MGYSAPKRDSFDARIQLRSSFMRLSLSVFVLLAGASVAATAGSLDVNLSRDSIEAKHYSSVGVAEMTVGGLYNQDQKNWAMNVGLLSTGESYNAGSRLEGGLGGKLYAVSVGNSQVLALGLGGQFRWFFGSGPIGIGGYAFYAPSVVTTMDGESFREVGVRADLELVKNSSLYWGYREVVAKLDNHTQQTVDKGSFVGIQIKF